MTYISEVRASASGPVFVVYLKSDPAALFKGTQDSEEEVVAAKVCEGAHGTKGWDDGRFRAGTSPSAPWAQVIRKVNERHHTRPTTSVSGPHEFGFANPQIRRLIERLPGAGMPCLSVPAWALERMVHRNPALP